MRRIGVYRITHVDSGRFYVGHSIDVHARLAVHRSLLCRGKHHCRHLQRAWVAYGEDAFKLSVERLFLSQAEAAKFEQDELDQNFSHGRLFNSLAINAPLAALNEARRKAHGPESQRKRVETTRRNGTWCAASRKPVECFLHASPRIMRFESVAAASRALGISAGSISLVCSGERSFAKGHTFWFVDAKV